jgi:hypothetical protein
MVLRSTRLTSLKGGTRWLVTLLFAVLSLVIQTIESSWAAPPKAPQLEQSALEDIFTPRRPIPYSLLGVNAFVNDNRFGTVRGQLREVRSTLGLKRVRVLFHWNDGVQATRWTQPNLTFYDQIINSLPRDVEALVILTGVPSWMKASRNWIDGNPRKTFIELWVKKVVARYATRARIVGFQVWNEPNNPSFLENATLDVLTKPDNYVELLALGHTTIKTLAPRKLVINAATTAIAQNYPSTYNYNRRMLEAGVLSFTDAYAIHYYGKSVERVLFGGIGEMLRGISKPIWITETGIQGINRQSEYAERILPFLKREVPSLSRIYLYQFTEATPANETFGLKNLTPRLTLSDLYIKLRDRQ